MALLVPASRLPKNIQFFMPSLVGRIMFSTRLVSISKTPCARQWRILGHWLMVYLRSLPTLLAGRWVFKVIEDKLIESVGDGEAAGAADEHSAGGRGSGLAGLGFDLIDSLDEMKNG